MERMFYGDVFHLPQQISNTVRVYVVSEFTDMLVEKNYLIQSIYPKLRDNCIARGMELEIVDLKRDVVYGLREDLESSEIFLKEIGEQGCSGAYFMAFIGNEYGYQSIPREIEMVEFELLLEMLKDQNEDSSLLDKCFQKDLNNVPPVYTCQTRDETNNSKVDIYKDVTSLLQKAARFALIKERVDKHQVEKYFTSVLEFEVNEGILKAPAKQSACFIRTYEDGNSGLDSRNIVMVDDDEFNCEERLNNLKYEKLRNYLHRSNYYQLEVAWKQGGINSQHLEHKLYLRQLGENVKQMLEKFINNFADENKRLGNIQRDDNLFNEVLHHSYLVKNYCKHFYSRLELLNKIHNALRSSVSASNKPLILYGEQGTGKSAVMAKIGNLLSKRQKESNLNVIYRFISTSPLSSNINFLLQTICQQLLIILNQDYSNLPYNTFSDTETLIQYFHDLTHSVQDLPLLIVLDGIDNLAADGNAYTLNWLPKRLNQNINIILSTDSTNNKILETLRKCFQTDENFIEIGNLDDQSSSVILRSFLSNVNRTLTAEQLHYSLHCIRLDSTPLNLSIQFDQVKKLASFSKQIVSPANITSMINNMFDVLERRFGKILVSHSLCYITSSKHGLSEQEIEDLLSLDDHVICEVYCNLQTFNENFIRLPSLLWKQIYHYVKTYLFLTLVDNTYVLKWKFRLFEEIIAVRYLRDSQSSKFIYSTLADYFSGKYHNKSKAIVCNKKNADKNEYKFRYIKPQPYVLDGNRYNKRKLYELPHALLTLGDRKTIFKAIAFNFEYIEHKIKSSTPNALLKDLQLVLELEFDIEIKALYDFIKISYKHLEYNKNSLAFEIIARLSCYDDVNYKKITALLQEAKQNISNGDGPVLSINNACMIPPGGSIVCTLRGKGRIVEVRFINSDSSIICLSMDETKQTLLQFWSLKTRECVKVLKYHCASNEPKMLLNENDSYLVLHVDYVYIISIKSKTEITQVESRCSEFINVALSSSRNLLCLYSNLGYMKLYSIDKMSLLKTTVVAPSSRFVDFVDASNTIVFSQSNKHLASFLKYETEEMIHIKLDAKQVGQKLTVHALICNSIFVIVAMDRYIHILNSENRSIHKTLKEHRKQINFLVNLAKDNFASCGADYLIKIWSIKKKICLKSLEEHNAPVTCLAYCALSNSLISGGEDHMIKTWNLKTYLCKSNMVGHISDITALDNSKEAHLIVSASLDKTIKVWSTKKIDLLQPSMAYHSRRPIGAAMSCDLTLVATISHEEVILWEERTHKIIDQIAEKPTCLVFSEDDHFLLLGKSNGFVNSYDTTKNKLDYMFSYKAHQNKVVSLLRLKSRGIILSSGEDGFVLLFNIYERRVVQILKNHANAVTCLIVSNNFEHLFSGSADNTVNAYRADGRQFTLVHQLQGHEKPITCLAVSNNNKYIISGSEDSCISIWYVSTGLNINYIKCSDHVISCVTTYGAALSVLTGSYGFNDQLKRWEPNTGECSQSFLGHTDTITKIEITEDENYLVTSSKDGTIKLWRTATAELLDSKDFESEVNFMNLSSLWNNIHYKLVALLNNGSVAFIHLIVPLTTNSDSSDSCLKLVEDERYQMEDFLPLKKKSCLCCAKYLT